MKYLFSIFFVLIFLNFASAKSTSINYSDSIYFNLKIVGNGTVYFKNINSKKLDTVISSKSISFIKNDSLSITVINNSTNVFNGYKGVINDTVNLQNKNLLLKSDSSFNLEVNFAKRDSGYKKIQNQFFDTTVLYNRASKNFIVWWDKRFDHDAQSKDMLKWAEWEWNKCIVGWGMTPPKGSDSLYINIYLHHKGNEGDGIDVFDDGWAQFVGTDLFGRPFLAEPYGKGSETIQNYPWSGSVHELFHIMQYYGTTNEGTFSYGDLNNRWYVEGTANYFQSYYCANLFPNVANPFLNDPPAFLLNPQLKLWQFDYQNDTISWSRACHGYGSQIFFDYLIWKKYITEDFIGKSFASKSKLSPVSYLYQNIPNFTNVYRDFALKSSVLDFPYFKPEINFWMQNWSSTVAYSPAIVNLGDVNTYAFSLVDTFTNGYVRPKEKNQAWSYTTTKIETTKKANYRIQYKVDSLGNSNTISNYYIGIVYQSSKKSNYQNVTSYKDNIDRPMYIGNNKYSSISLINVKCDTTISLPDSTIAYLVAVSTPQSFSGNEIFDYQINVQKSQFTCPYFSPKPLFNTSKFSICSGDSIKLSISNINSGDTIKWFYGTKSDLTNVSNKTFTDSTKLYVTRTDSIGCVISSDTITLVKNVNPLTPQVSDTTFCQNTNFSKLTAKNSNGASLAWYGTNSIGSIASANSPNAITTDTITKYYFVSQINSITGCESPRAKITVKINPTPKTPIVRDTFYCYNINADTLRFTPNDGNSLLWYGNNATGGTPSNLGFKPTTSVVGNFSYYVSQINNTTGCEGDRAKVNVLINPLPSAPIVKDTSYCNNGTSDTIRVSPTSGNTLLWYGTNATGGTATNTSLKPSTNIVGIANYYVSQINTLTGCESSRSKINITTYPIPTAPTLSRDTANNLVASINVITWYKDGAAITDTTQKIKPTIGGSYTAKTTQNGCTSALSTPYYYLVTDIINLSADEFIKLSPNPFSNQLNFDFVVKGYQRLNMDIFDIATGTKVASKQNLTPGIPVYLGQLTPGTYVIKVISSDLKLTYQFKI